MKFQLIRTQNPSTVQTIKMQFSAVIATAILSVAAAAPLETRHSGSTAPLSITQQLSLTDVQADRYTLLPDDSAFVFNFNQERGKGGLGGDIFAANRKTFPALVGSGSGMALGFLGPCGFNTPHVHLRATELQVVTKGKVVVEMVPENGVFRNNDKTQGRRVVMNTLLEGMMTPFYQGTVHSQFNPDCEPANFVASFNNEDFGTGQVADELFALDAEVVSAVFGQGIDGAMVEQYKGKIPANIARGVETCLAKCGIPKK